MTKKKLSSKEYDELLKIARRWPDPYRGLLAKLVHHIAYQFDELKKLEDEVRDLRQARFFEEKRKIESQAAVKAHNVALGIAPPPRPCEQEKWPLGRRLSDMLRAGIAGSSDWQLTLKYNRLSDEQARTLASEYDSTR